MRNAILTYLLIISTFMGVHLIIPYTFPFLLPEWIIIQINSKKSWWKGLGALTILITLYAKYSALSFSTICILYISWYSIVLLGQRTLQSFSTLIQVSSVVIYFTLLTILQYRAIYGIIEIRKLTIAVVINALLFGALHIYRTQNDWLEEFLQG